MTSQPLHEVLKTLHTLCCHRHGARMLAAMPIAFARYDPVSGATAVSSALEARMAGQWLRKLASLGHQFEPHVHAAELFLMSRVRDAVGGAMERGDVEAAREWVRPGIGVDLVLYDEWRHVLHGALERTLRGARADALRMGLLTMTTHMLNRDWRRTIAKFEALLHSLPLEDIDLDDHDELLGGTPAAVWRLFVKPLLDPRMLSEHRVWSRLMAFEEALLLGRKRTHAERLSPLPWALSVRSY